MRKKTLLITLLFTILLLAMMSYSIMDGDVYGVVTAVACIALLWVPATLEQMDIITHPWPIVMSAGIALSLHCLGLVTDWYNTTFVWDKITHLFSGIVLGSLVAVQLMIMDRQIKTVAIPPAWFLFLITASILTLESVWEIIEFSFDQLIGTSMQHSLVDTVNDVITNTISGIVAGLGVIYGLRKYTADEFVETLHAEKLVRWFKGRFGRKTYFR
jgi:hypothetical protein